MEEILEQELNIDKSSWQMVRFGDVVKEPKEFVKDPAASGIQQVIGLEHIESENIHLRNYATLEDSTTFTKAFKKGDVLFGRRRAYLKKAALAPFSGICSGDITVFRAKENLLPELIPFIVNNDKFFDYAVKHSAGGLSPRVKFKDLSKYELLLPPKNQQKQFAKMLWAMEEVIVNENNNVEKLNKLKLTTTEAYLTGKKRINGFKIDNYINDKKLGEIPSSWNIYYLKDILTNARLGGNYPNSENDNGLPLIKMGNLSRGYINIERVQYVPKDYNHDSKDLLKYGDLLFNTRNTLELVGKVAIWKNELPQALYNSNIMRFEFDKEKISSNEFMNLIFNSRRGINQLRAFATGTTSVAAIYAPELKRFKCAIPTKNEQEKIVEIVATIQKSIDATSSGLESSRTLQKSLINQIF